MILQDSVVIIDKKYYPQIFLEECKYTVEKKKIINVINEEINLDESDDDGKSNESDAD